MKSNDFSLRPENLHALSLAGLTSPTCQLLTLSDLSFMTIFPSHDFALVDHNRLGVSYVHTPGAQVTALIDHHQDEGLYLSASPRIVSPCGSCASHLGLLFTPSSPLPPELATLLLAAILIDTSGLKPGGKATPTDVQAVAFLGPRSTYASSFPKKVFDDVRDDPTEVPWEKAGREVHKADALKNLTRVLEMKKDDVAHLGGIDLLRRDYKESIYTLYWAGDHTVKVGLSTVPLPLDRLDKDGTFGDVIISWMETRGIQVLGVLTSFNGGSAGKGKHKREMAWVVYGGVKRVTDRDPEGEAGVDFERLAQMVWKGLEESTELQVKEHKRVSLEKGKLPIAARGKVYLQGNANASRKAIAPLIKDIVEGSENYEKKPKRRSFLTRRSMDV